jgi:hypothetical protein
MMPTTTPAQVANHQSNISAAEGERQRAMTAARLAYNGLASGFAAFDAATLAADLAYMDALLVSAAANGFAGPVHSRAQLTRSRSI